MKELFYTSERNHQILIALLKEYGIRKIVVSPGATNITFVGSVQHDSFFELFSCIDERSAAYMACGIAEESGEPVAISCTGATSARNYMPGLTEAFYRKLPIVAITSTQDRSRVGHLHAQVTDRSNPPRDVVVKSVFLQTIKDETDTWDCYIKVNKALQAIKTNGGGPVHIDLTTTYSFDYSIKELPNIKKIQRYEVNDILPPIPDGRVAIFVGAHHRWTEHQTQVLDAFCSKYDAVVLCDHSSNYRGKYRVLSALAGLQHSFSSELLDIDLLIHIGEMSGGYEAFHFRPQKVWRVNEDGEIRDQFKKITAVFSMSPEKFFSYYYDNNIEEKHMQLDSWRKLNETLYGAIPELPFSNIWIAYQISAQVPYDSVLYLGILNSLRSWNFFEVPNSVTTHSNTGGFGIDGILSTMIGSSLVSPNKLHFAVLGDLSCFYDLNVLGNRHVADNVRIMVINNGKGMEFRLINHNGSIFGDEADLFMAAGGHNGNRSPQVLKSYVESLGYKYIKADSKEEFLKNVEVFFSPEKLQAPVVFEVFTDTEGETGALKIMEDLIVDNLLLFKTNLKKVVKRTISKTAKETIKNVMKY